VRDVGVWSSSAVRALLPVDVSDLDPHLADWDEKGPGFVEIDLVGREGGDPAASSSKPSLSETSSPVGPKRRRCGTRPRSGCSRPWSTCVRRSRSRCLASTRAVRRGGGADPLSLVFSACIGRRQRQRRSIGTLGPSFQIEPENLMHAHSWSAPLTGDGNNGHRACRRCDTELHKDSHLFQTNNSIVLFGRYVVGDSKLVCDFLPAPPESSGAGQDAV